LDTNLKQEEMIEFRINEKPLSVNEAWQGKRFKTQAYKDYEKSILIQMPKKSIDKKAMLRIDFFFGFSNVASDLDNPVKLLLDICQKKYGFDDRQVFEMNIRKCIVKKGKEFIEMGIFQLLPFE
jgi:Holliday junction resolvase RusA-like endonuclease